MDNENSQDAKSAPPKKTAKEATDAVAASIEVAAAPVVAAPGVEAPATAPVPVTATPEVWAERLGLIQRANPRLPQSQTVPHWTHAAANKLYGWSDHAYHYQGEAPFELTEDDYRKALAAAAQYPVRAPHPPALPKSQVKRFEGFVPSPSRKPEAV